jgi:bacterioferritin-associated ferredoxin
MIVCSCNVFSDRDVRSAIDTSPARPATANQVYGCLGCSPQCGRCARAHPKRNDEALSGASADACAQACPVACAQMHAHAPAATDE